VLALFTALHLLVDGICGAALAVYAVEEPFLAPIMYYFGLYNAFAFGTQWLTGLVLDKKRIWIRGAFVFSLLMLALGTVTSFGIAGQAVLLGIGNSVFHVAAGSYVLQRYQTYKELGLFVSSGAIGLALGLNLIIGPYPFLLAGAVLTVVVTRQLLREDFFFRPEAETRRPAGQESGPTVQERFSAGTGICLLLLLGCIVLRGMGSGGMHSPYIMLFPCMLAFGKVLGGLLCDFAGYKRTILVIFLMGFVALQSDAIILRILLVLAFNMTMPLTLRLVHWCNPRYPGMMFGLAAGCLLPGVYYHGFSLVPQAMIVLQFLCLAAAGYLLRNKNANPADKKE